MSLHPNLALRMVEALEAAQTALRYCGTLHDMTGEQKQIEVLNRFVDELEDRGIKLVDTKQK